MSEPPFAFLHVDGTRLVSDRTCPPTTRQWRHVACFPCYGWWVDVPCYFRIGKDLHAHPDVYARIVEGIRSLGVDLQTAK